MRALACLALLCGCGAAAQALPPPDRAFCYAVADVNAQRRVDLECSKLDGVASFAECPAHDDIMAQLKRDQEACPQ